jgi:hypothetical protein
MSRGPRRDKQDLLGIVTPKAPLASSPSQPAECDGVWFQSADVFDLRCVRIILGKTCVDFVGVGRVVVHR